MLLILIGMSIFIRIWMLLIRILYNEEILIIIIINMILRNFQL